VFLVTGAGGTAHTVQQLAASTDRDGALAAPPAGGKLAKSVKKASAAGEGEVLMIAGGYSDSSLLGGAAAADQENKKKGGYSSTYNLFNATSGTWESGEWVWKLHFLSHLYTKICSLAKTGLEHANMRKR